MLENVFLKLIFWWNIIKISKKSKANSYKKLFKDRNIEIYQNIEYDSIEFMWRKFISSKILQEELERVYDCFFEEGCKKMLCDMRKMGALPFDAQQYIDTQWMPRMIQLGVKIYVFVMPPSASAGHTVDQLREQRAEKEAQAGIKTFFYGSIDAARDCIASMSIEDE